MIVRDPWGKEHRVNDNYDKSDLIIPSGNYTFNEMVPEDILTKNNFTFNVSSTRVNEKRASTLINLTPIRRANGELISQRKKTNW